jgi:ribosomal protein L7/L12
VPRAGVFLDALRSRVEIAPKVAVSADFSDLQGLPREQQEKRLRELDQRGQTIAAVYLARGLYGCDLREATNLVKNLRGDVQP